MMSRGVRLMAWLTGAMMMCAMPTTWQTAQGEAVSSEAPTATVQPDASPVMVSEVTSSPLPDATEAPTATAAPDITEEPTESPSSDATEAPTATAAPDITEEPTPSPLPDATEAPTATAAPDITEEPTLSPLPDATEAPTTSTAYPLTDADVAFSRLTMRTASTALADERVTLTLAMEADLPEDSTLATFSMDFDFGGMAEVRVEALAGAEFTDNRLTVKDAVVRDGKICVKGAEVSLSVSGVPFPQGGANESVRVTWQVLDQHGRAVDVSSGTGDANRIHTSCTVNLAPEEATAAPTAEPEAPVASEEPTSAPTAEPEAPVASEEPTSAPTAEPEASTASEEPTSAPTAEQEAPTASGEPVSQRVWMTYNIAPMDLHIGSELVLEAHMEGFDRDKVRIQWQRCHDGVWSDMAGENGETCTIVMTEEQYHDTWRFDVQPAA